MAIPVNLASGTNWPVIPSTDGHYSNHRALNQWLDANFFGVLSAQSGRVMPRPIIQRRNQSPHITKVRENIVPVYLGPHAYAEKTHNCSNPFLPVVTSQDLNLSNAVDLQGTPRFFTQLPQIALDAMGPAVDLTGITIPWTTSMGLREKKNRRSTVAADVQVMRSSYIHMDYVGTISFFEQGFADKWLIRDEFEHKAPDELIGLKFKRLSRGNRPVETTVGPVSKKEVLDGDAWFLYKSTTEFLNQKTMTKEKIEFYSLGIFTEVDDYLTYRKARRFLITMQDMILNNGNKLFAPELHHRTMVEEASEFTKFWDGVTDIINFGSMNVIPDPYDEVKRVLESKEHFTNPQLRSLSADSAVSITAVGKQFKRAQQNQAQLTIQAQDANDTKRTAEKRLKDLREQIRVYVEQIRYLEESMRDLRLNLESSERSVPSHESSVKSASDTYDELEQYLEDAKKAFKTASENRLVAVKEYIQNPDAPDLFQNMLSSGIVIKDILVRTPTGTQVSCRESPAYLVDQNCIMSEITMITTRPSKVYVDRDKKGNKAEVVAAGPFEIRIKLNDTGKPQMGLRLASHNSVFGMKKTGDTWKCKPHPHTDSTVVYPTLKSVTEFIHDWKSCCLGEVENTIRKGMDQKNPQLIIGAILSWLSSAWTEDQWGKEWGWFPFAATVNFSGHNRAEKPPAPDIEDVLKLISIKIKKDPTTTTNP